MLKVAVVLVCLVAGSTALERYATSEETLSVFKELLRLPQMFGRDMDSPESPFEFKYDDCGSSSALGHLKSLAISPDPIPLPGNITVSASGSISGQIASPIKASVTLEKKVGIWIKIPCIDQIGSCEYEDLCSLIPSGPCPPILSEHNIPCHCPFAAGNYSLPSTPISIEVGNLPSWLANGDYHGKAELTGADGKEIACVEAYVSLKTG